MTSRADAELIQLLTRTLVLTTWTLAQNVKNNLKRSQAFPPDQIEDETRKSPIVARACDALKVALGVEFDPLGEAPYGEDLDHWKDLDQ
jgi:hypothetical protein